jgi:hypothetical protein
MAKKATGTLEKPDFVVVHIGARGKRSRREAKHAAALWKQLQREAPQAHFQGCHRRLRRRPPAAVGNSRGRCLRAHVGADGRAY